MSFQGKCSFELLDKYFYALLSNLLPTEGLWGSCDLLADLKFNDKFDRNENIMR